MPTGRLNMRRIRDVLRLKFGQGLSGVCQRSCPPISCGVSNFRGAGFVFGVKPDGSCRLPVAGFA